MESRRGRDCFAGHRKIAVLDELHDDSLLEKGLVEVGAVNLAMAQGARLKERLLTME